MNFEPDFFAYRNEGFFSDLQYYNDFQYPLYPMRREYAKEASYERDLRKLQELFPVEARLLQEQVKEQCDQLEYEGSAMFDEYPDRYTLESICRRIYKNAYPQEELQGTAYFKNPIYQMIQVMLIAEMYFRRCRYTRGKRRYW